MTHDAQLPDLSERSVLLSLQEITEMMGPWPEDAPQDLDEAATLLSELLVLVAPEAADLPWQMLRNEEAARAAAPRILLHLLQDADTSQAAQDVISDPPSDNQMAVEAAHAGAVVVSVLVAFLTTKVRFRIRGDRGRSMKYDFEVNKEAVDGKTLQQLVLLIIEWFKGAPRQ
ncbi:hypothetical protein [Streptomyces sp. NPDC054804]